MNSSHQLINQRFGKGIVIKQVPKPEHLKRNGFYWLVRCDCGGTSIVDTTTLKKKWQCCGCEDLTGERFHNGVVVAYEGKDGKGHRRWRLVCDCGENYVSLTQSLKSDNTKSCGCLNSRKGKNSPHYKGHEDLSGDYWCKLKRGAKTRNLFFDISIEQAWALFLHQKKQCALTGWSIDLTKKDGKQTASLDRIDSTKHYTLNNVQWVHKDINRIKWDFPEDYFFSMCEAIILKRSKH